MLKNKKYFFVLCFLLLMGGVGGYFLYNAKASKVNSVQNDVLVKKIVIYSASWCNSCEVAKRYMTEEKIAFEERDVEKNSAYQAEWQALNSPGIPVLLIGNSKLEGFDVDKFQELLQKMSVEHKQE